jgi:RNA polymerase sigma-70 factor (ECF subfamily)
MRAVNIYKRGSRIIMRNAMASHITFLLGEVRCGEQGAQSRLASVVYDELHRLAAYYMRREWSSHTLQPTALVHEAFIKLVNEHDRTWQNRAHFFAVSAKVMRHLLIDQARRHRAEKRGGGAIRVEWDGSVGISNLDYERWLAVDEALNHLTERDPRLSQVVELRFFAGLTEEEIGEVLGISSRTVKREWKVAKAWLADELSPWKSE